MQTYIEAWKMGLKAVAIYRDGSKRLQPLNTGKKKEEATPEQRAGPAQAPAGAPAGRARRPSPTSSPSRATRATSRSGMYPNGKPGEMFISMAKEGSVVSGLMDSFATACRSCCSTACP